jgi:hypothetical protein
MTSCFETSKLHMCWANQSMARQKWHLQHSDASSACTVWQGGSITRMRHAVTRMMPSVLVCAQVLVKLQRADEACQCASDCVGLLQDYAAVHTTGHSGHNQQDLQQQHAVLPPLCVELAEAFMALAVHMIKHRGSGSASQHNAAGTAAQQMDQSMATVCNASAAAAAPDAAVILLERAFQALAHATDACVVHAGPEGGANEPTDKVGGHSMCAHDMNSTIYVKTNLLHFL